MAQVDLLAGGRKRGEHNKHVRACNDYLRMDIGRSLRGLQDEYRHQSGSEAAPEPPTTRLTTLKVWSSKYDWVARAQEFDKAEDERRTARREEAMQTGVALPGERVRKLKRLEADLEDQLYETSDEYPAHHVGHRSRLWVRDVKQIGGGPHAREVEIFRYNSALISDYLQVLDDLAKETGGRVKRADVTSGGQPLLMTWTDDSEGDG